MSQRVRLWHILAVGCDVSAELVSQSHDEPLTRTEKLVLWSHLLLCRPCRRLRQQLVFLHEAVHRFVARTEEDTDTVLSADARSRILSAVTGALGE